MFIYVGTYSRPPQGNGEGIYGYRFDPDTGSLEHVHTTSGVVNPSFLALDREGRCLYAVNEGERGQVTAFQRDPDTGALSQINSQVSEGDGPCYVSVSFSGRYVLVANYGSGSVAALPVRDDGGLHPASSAVQHHGSSANPERQEGPHAHMIAPTPDNRFVLAVDLGIDRVVGYRLDDANGSLAAVGESAGAHAEPGAGPRHFAFTPDGRYVFVINELASTLTAYAYDGDTGALEPLQTESTLYWQEYDRPSGRLARRRIRLRFQPGPRQHQLLGDRR
jgi:6-phosphogluconolactonase